MKRFINGDETELTSEGFEVIRLPDRLVIRTPEGSHTAVAVRQGDALLISYKGNQFRIEERISRAKAGQHVSSGELRAPMPGQIVDVRHKLGDVVKKGDTILVLEAMKTQQPFPAPFDGKVGQVLVSKGDQVFDGSLLAVIEPVETAHV